MAGRLRRRIRHGLTRFRWPLAGLAAVMVVLACVLVIPQWLVRWELGAQARTLAAAERAKATNDVRATLLQGVGGVVILLGAYYTYRQLQTGREQLQIAQQGQVTERFTRAIDQLGHAELDVRLGGIYALERIASDSPDDRTTIAEVLTAFVRGHAPWPPRLTGQYHAEAPIEQVPELQVRAPNADSRTAIAYAGIASCGRVNAFAPKPVGRYCGRRIGVMSLYTNGRWSKPCDRRSVYASPRERDAQGPVGQAGTARRPRHRRHDALVLSEATHAGVGLTAPNRCQERDVVEVERGDRQPTRVRFAVRESKLIGVARR